MVLGIIVIVALIATAFTFRNELKGFAQDLRKEKTPEQEARDERGAVQNTQAFILGEKGLADLQAESELNRMKIDQFIKGSQTQIDQIVTGVNTSLAESQKQLQNFADQSQQNIINSQKQISDALDVTKSAFGTASNEIITGFGVAGNQIVSFFGGQQEPKEVQTQVQQTPKITITPKGSEVDSPRAISVELFEGGAQDLLEEEAEKTRQTRSTRFS